jgi:hypothetical protein
MPGDGMRGDFEPLEPPVPKGLDGSPLRKKLIFTIVVFCGLVFVILAVPFTGIAQPLKGLDMWLSKPRLSGTNISGTFKLQYRRGGFDSDATGGVCLIADIAKLVPAHDVHKVNGEIHEGTCTTKAECNPKGFSTVIWEGYCVPDGPKKPSRCWYRPADNDPMKKLLCHTSGHHPDPAIPPNLRGTPWPVGVVQIVPYSQAVPNEPDFDLAAFYQVHTNGKAARWRLSGRLFGKAAPQENFGAPACVPAGKCK